MNYYYRVFTIILLLLCHTVWSMDDRSDIKKATREIEQVIKNGQAENLPLNQIISTIIQLLKINHPEVEDNQLKTNLIIQWAQKVYYRIHENVLFYDGRTQTLNSAPALLGPNGQNSNWYKLPLPALLSTYLHVHRARKNLLPHPFAPMLKLDDPEAELMDAAEDFVISKPAHFSRRGN